MELDHPSGRAFGLPLTIIAAGAIVAGVFMMQHNQSVPAPSPTTVAAVTETPSPAPAIAGAHVEAKTIVINSADPTAGSDTAPTTVFLFTQFHCPFCRHFFEATWPQVEERFVATGQVRFVIKLFPIGDDEESPAEAEGVALAALCAQEQGAFWTAVPYLLTVESGSAEAEFQLVAERAGLAVEPFMACWRNKTYADVVATTVREAVAAGVTGTPTFIIGDRLYEGALSVAELEHLFAAL